VWHARADIPAQASWKLTPDAAYVHICANETIQGVEFKVSSRLRGHAHALLRTRGGATRCA
jgi:phosphoserine aminotransferase